MRVSYLELYAHCKKVLEGCGFPIGCAEEGAEIVAWGEFTNLYGIGQLAAELSTLQTCEFSKIHVLAQDDRLVSIDGQGQSNLLSGRVALDLAVAKAAEMGIGIAHVTRSRGSLALIQQVAQAGKRGVSCAVHWVEEYSQTWAYILPGQRQPFVMTETFKQPRKAQQTDSFLLLCADFAHVASLVKMLACGDEKENVKVIRPEQLQAAWDESNKQGKEVDPAIWAELGQVASRVLVEATERSRQLGAGEGANSFR